MFDAGAIEAKLTIDTSAADRSLDAFEAKVKKFQDEPHKVKLMTDLDTSSMAKARKMFGDLDNAISKDAMSRLRSSPQGSVLGALNALFSPHPVTGAPSPQQAASQGLLGKMVSAPGGGGPPTADDSRITGSNDTGTSLGSLLEQAPGNVSTTDDVNQKLTGQGPGNVNTTDTIKQDLTGNAPGNVTTTDTIKRDVVGAEPGNISTTDTIKEKLDPDSTAQVEKDSGTSGDKSGQSFAAGFMGHLKNLLGKSVTDATEQAAGDSGDRSGTRFTVGFGGHMGPFFASLTKSFGDAGGKGGTAMGTGLLGGIGPGILGISAKLSGIVGLVGSALGALPALAGIVGTGMGVAMIGGLVAGAIATSPGLQKEFTSIGAQAKTMIMQATAPIVPAIQAILSQVPGLLKQLEPQLASISAAIAPQLQQVFSGLIPIINGLVGVMQAAAPAFGPFIGALESLVSNIFPGIATVVKATIPFITQFAGILSGLGSDLGGLFATAAPAIGASMQILGGLLGLVGDLLPVVMKLADIFATSLAPVFLDFAGVIKTLLPPLTLVGSVIASFAGAVIGDLASAFGAVAALIDALAPSLGTLATTLSGVFTVLENTGVFAVFGDALENLVVPLAGLINALVTGLAPVLPVLTAAFSQLVTDAIDVLSVSLGAVLTALTPVVSFLAQAVTAVVGFLQSTGLLLPVMAGLALTFGPVASGLTAMAAGMAAFAGSSFVAGISGIIASIGAFAAATEGATLAEKGLFAAELLMDSINPFALIAVGVAGFTALAVVMARTASTMTGITANLAAQDDAVGYNIAGYQKLSAQLDTVSDSYTKVASGIQDSVRGGNGAAAQLAAQAGTAAAQFSALAQVMQSRLTTLSAGLGVSQTTIEQWASAAGISATKFAGAGENVGSLTAAIVAYVNKNASAITSTASLATNMDIFGNDVFSTTAQLDAFNAIWNTLVGNLLTKQEALTSSKTQFDNLAQTIKTSGANSDAANQSFQQYIAQIGSSASTLVKQGASISTVNSYLQTQIDHIQSLGPLNASEKADLAALKTFQDALANSTKGLTDNQLTWIQQAEGHIIPDLVKMHANTPLVNTDINNLANAIAQTGTKSAATEADRAQLIADIAKITGNTGTATQAVDGWITALGKVPKSVSTTITLTAAARGTITAATASSGGTNNASVSNIAQQLMFGATGGPVTGMGGPTDDMVPAWLSNGEYIIQASSVDKYGKAFFDSLNARRFAAGGINLAAPQAWMTGDEDNWATDVGTAFMKAEVTAYTKEIQAAAAAAAKSAAAFIGSQGATGGIIQAMFASMAAAKGWTGAQLTALLEVEAREAGFNMTAQNPTSGAYGLAQFIDGPSEYAQYGGNSTTASGQITAMLNYISQRYGTPEAAWAHEENFGWYGNGGMISEPVIGYGVNSGRGYVLGERGSEMVTPIGGARGGKTVDDLAARLDQLHADMQQMVTATRQAPAATGQHVGSAINGAAHNAGFRSRYPRSSP